LSDPRQIPGDQSVKLYARACDCLVGGVNSPVRAHRAVGGQPVFVDRAEGCRIIDADGRSYIDLVGSWGPAVVGHAHPAVVERVQAAARCGLSFGACHAAEAQLAELIRDALPHVEQLRFVSSGTEATMSALRLARGVTGRSRILKFEGCYHGHADGLLVAAGSGSATFGVPDSAGVPAEVASLTAVAPYNDASAVEALLEERPGEIAAIIVEPVAGNMGLVLPEPDFLARLRELCDRHGCLLIFDEVMTGFRVAWGGYQNICGVRPDITCLGKVVGGGLPVAAFGGRREIMRHLSPEGRVYQAGTLSGNPLGMAAGLATLELCRAPGFYERLAKRTQEIASGLREAAQRAGVAVQVEAIGGMLGLFFSARAVRNFADARAADHALYARFFGEMLARGVWLPPSGYEALFVSAAHDEAAVRHIVEAAADSLGSIAP
jgi:glutamate-1-semialdehyde 2,1-aminomutase